MPTWTAADQDECWFVFNCFFKEEFLYFTLLNASMTNKCFLAKTLQVVSDGHQEMDLPDQEINSLRTHLFYHGSAVKLVIIYIGKTFTRIFKILLRMTTYSPFINIAPIILGVSLNKIRTLTALHSYICVSSPSASVSVLHVQVLHFLLARIWHILILKK